MGTVNSIMSTLNRVLLLGKLTADPVLVTLPHGTVKTELKLAVADDRAGKAPHLVTVVVWGRQAENSVQALKGGSRVLIEGKLNYEEWLSNGKTASKLEVVASSVQFLDP